MSETINAAKRLAEKSKVERLKKEFFATTDFSQIELRVAAHIETSEPECEKCGRRYCDHETKY